MVTVVAAVSPGPQGGEGAADRGHARRRAAEQPATARRQRIVVGVRGARPRRRWPCSSACSAAPTTRSPSSALGAVLVFFGVSVLGRTVSLPLSRRHRRAAAPPPGRRRRAGPGERHAQPQAHGGQRLGADDRRRPGGFITILAASTKASFDTHHRPGLHRRPRRRLRRVRRLGRRRPEPGRASSASCPRSSAATGIRAGMAEVDGARRAPRWPLDPATAFEHRRRRAASRARPPTSTPTPSPCSRTSADDKGLQLGDTVPVMFKDTGAEQLTVALIYGENAAGRRLPARHRPPTRPTSPTSSTPRSSSRRADGVDAGRRPGRRASR